MIETLRQIRSRIKGAENIKKITRAMEMVSAAKLNRAKKAFYASRPYFLGMEGLLRDLLADTGTGAHPLLEKREDVKNVALCVIASDTGLCGTHNYNLLRAAEAFLGCYDKKGVRLITVGKDAFSYFKKLGYQIEKDYSGSYGRYSADTSDAIVRDLVGMFLSGKADEVHIAYTHFISSLKRSPAVEKLLNIDLPGGTEMRYILEPGAEAILNDLIPSYLYTKMRSVMLDAFTSEHTARMLAMKTATDNADDMIDSLTLTRNKARQFAITKEVLEIAMSAEALKG
jgi:F-type H+-transporting ATPase subunit gamma